VNRKLEIISLQPKTKLNDLNYNLKNYKRLFEKYSVIFRSAQVICFPEYWNGIRKDFYNQTLFEKSIEFLEELAVSTKKWIIGGSQLIKDQVDTYLNRSHIFDPSGNLVGTYDKRQPFGYEKIQGINAGKKELIWKINDWKAGIRICSDLWNTSDYSSLVTQEIDLLFCPILTTLQDSSYTNYGRFLWHNLAVIRAKEAAAAVIISDTAKQPIREPYWSAGASCLADPSKKFRNQEITGQRILSTIPSGEEGVLSVKLDLHQIREQRQYRKDIGLLNI
jgi:predicted amidohydrolase